MAVGVILVAACALLGATLLGGSDDTVGVWAARRAMNAGESVSADDLVRRDVRFADQHDADTYLSGDTPLPSGATLARAVGAGEMVPRGALGAAGSQALIEVPLSVDSEAVPSTLRVGAVVDVWVTPDRATDVSGPVDGSDAPRSVLVFDDVAADQVVRGHGLPGVHRPAGRPHADGVVGAAEQRGTEQRARRHEDHADGHPRVAPAGPGRARGGG